MVTEHTHTRTGPRSGRWWGVATLGLACAGDPAPQSPSGQAPAVHDEPWRAATEATGTIDGAFSAVVGDALPGAGWFSSDLGEGRSFARAALHDVEGADWPVLAVRLYGHSDAGWTVLELDFASPAFAAGPVELDGDAAVGALSLPDGSEHAVVGGVVTLDAAGVQPGERVKGTFEGLSLWRMP